MSVRNRPVASTRSGTRCGGSTGRPSTSTRCRPTRSCGSRRARGDRVRGRGGADHQACGGQDAALMRGFDRLVDLTCEPEIVGGDDQALQSAGSRRSRRNRKNSTPSRSRRLIISGLRTISPTMEAIFGARK